MVRQNLWVGKCTCCFKLNILGISFISQLSKLQSGGTFCYHTETFFIRTINTHRLKKVRFPLPECAVLLIIMQIRQT